MPKDAVPKKLRSSTEPRARHGHVRAAPSERVGPASAGPAGDAWLRIKHPDRGYYRTVMASSARRNPEPRSAAGPTTGGWRSRRIQFEVP
ncbi:hypothetical protein LV779_26295 [Streptomyces thinghirensis]|nr:hypothetical protein [Streptomyces thinghirensis]